MTKSSRHKYHVLTQHKQYIKLVMWWLRPCRTVVKWLMQSISSNKALSMSYKCMCLYYPEFAVEKPQNFEATFEENM